MPNSIHSKETACMSFYIPQKNIIAWLPINFDGKFPDMGGYWLPKVKVTEKYCPSLETAIEKKR